MKPWPIDPATKRSQIIPCDNCGTASIVILDTPNGCVGRPGQKRLRQCPQHLNNWGYLEGGADDKGIQLITEVEPGIAKWAGWLSET